MTRNHRILSVDASRCGICGWLVALTASFTLALATASEPSDDKAIPEPPPTPSIVELRLTPATLQLKNARDARKVLVSGRTAAGQWLDLTGQATFEARQDTVHVDEDGYVSATQAGEGHVRISAAGLDTELAVSLESAEAPDILFIKDVQPILGKVGCNAGTCHGSAQGKNGFRLSLRGYDPEFDYQALVHDLSGRRINRVAVDQSLMLQKPLGDVPHEGLQVITPGSRYHEIVRQWIVEGATYDQNPDNSRPSRIEVFPESIEIDLPGRRQHFLVIAHFPDGTTRDVTREAVFSVSDIERVHMDEHVAIALRRGEAAVLVRYDGLFATREVTILGDRTGFVWNDPPAFNEIDEHIYAKLRKVKVLPSDLCTDAEFIRRVSLDLTGMPATADRTRAFLEDSRPSREKREALIEQLLGSSDFVEFWANKWADLLQCNSETLGDKGVWMFRNWIRDSIRENKPYDRFVQDLLSAEGSAYRNPAVNYYRALRDTGKITEDVSQTFLGVRFNCNKCHDHPFEKWTQNQYYEFGAYFARVAMKRGQLPGEEIVYRNYGGGEVRHPKTDTPVAPKVPFAPHLAEKAEADGADDRREPFIGWLTSEENPLFARSMANRIWSYFLGRGIIEPVDDIRAGNPPSNPELLDTLTREFIDSGFDTRHLMRLICHSRTYQLSIRTNRWNEDDDLNFSHATPRRLNAEQLLDAIAVATGKRPSIPGIPASLRAVQIPDGTVPGDDFLKLFGRPKRQSACECERTSNISLSHAMNLINGNTISQAVHAKGNAIEQIVQTHKDDGDAIAETIYLSCLNRMPSEAERQLIDWTDTEDSLALAQDLAWALLNSPAFLFNR